MGEVYNAVDTRLGRTVATKIIREPNADTRQRFRCEARAISSLNHPLICGLYDVGQHDGIDYLVMEYLEGETLAARLKKSALPLTEVLQIGREIVGALDFLFASRVEAIACKALRYAHFSAPPGLGCALTPRRVPHRVFTNANARATASSAAQEAGRAFQSCSASCKFVSAASL